MSDPIEAFRSKPGEFFLAAEKVAKGDRFQVRDVVYEVASDPRQWGVGWVATVKVVQGLRPGSEFRAMLFTGRKVEG